MVGYGARQHIRKNALQHLHQEIAITRKQGSITLEESLARLARDGVVDARGSARPRRAPGGVRERTSEERPDPLDRLTPRAGTAPSSGLPATSVKVARKTQSA